jgi:PIN domain nuclease of toxin-antitoxin system
LGSVAVILIDTHIWIWWVQGAEWLTASQQHVMEEHETDGLGVSVISCWEVALPTADRKLLDYPHVQTF